jgi:acyl carrier protein
MDRVEAAKAVIARVTGREPTELREDMQLVADLGVDSVKGFQLLADLEDALDIDEIGEEDAARMNSVGDVLEHVRRLS